MLSRPVMRLARRLGRPLAVLAGRGLSKVVTVSGNASRAGCDTEETMFLKTTRILAALAAVLLVTTVAWAVTEAELIEQATELEADYQDLKVLVVAHVGPKSAREAAYAALEAQRAQLKADRATLQGCGCGELDGLIADIDVLSDDIQRALDEWN